jgi:hypothetical protein
LGACYDWEGKPINPTQWSILFHDERHVGDDQIGEVQISTVWVGLDYNFSGVGPPLIFETMIFGGPLDQEQWRYSTEQEAREGHKRAVELVQLQEQLGGPCQGNDVSSG